MKEFEHFYNAADELDALIEEGMFGEAIANRNRQRETKERNQYLYDCFFDMFTEDQYGLKNMIGIMFRLLEMYTDSIKVKSQETVDILGAFIKGTKDHPELESMSSYSQCLISFANHKNILSEQRKKISPTKADVTRLANAILSSYSKGVELIGKAFTHLLTLQEIINNLPYDLYQNSFLTIYAKMEKFEELACEQYKILTSVIDRKVRNADAHLNAYYSIEKQHYTMKQILQTKGGRKEINTFYISAQEMIFALLPKISWFIRGFIGSCILLVLVYDNNALYKKATDYIMSLSKRSDIL